MSSVSAIRFAACSAYSVCKRFAALPKFFSEKSSFMSGPSDGGCVVHPSYIGLGRAPNKQLIATDGRMEPSKGGLSAANPSRFLDVSPSFAAFKRGASQMGGAAGRAHQKGVAFGIRHTFSFDRPQLVIQQVIPSYFSMKALMEQLQLRLLCRLDAPSVVPPQSIAECKTYRDAVKLCWSLRRVSNMTQAKLAEEAGLYAPHVSCYINDGKRQRDLPGWAVRGFEWVCGNTAISQWHASQAKLTCLEEMQAMREAA